MLRWAVIFLVIAIVAALFGFTGIAAGAAAIAKFLFGLFLLLCLIFFILSNISRQKSPLIRKQLRDQTQAGPRAVQPVCHAGAGDPPVPFNHAPLRLCAFPQSCPIHHSSACAFANRRASSLPMTVFSLVAVSLQRVK